MQSLLKYSLLLLAVLTVGSSAASAQPLPQIEESLEWRCIDASLIVLGTIVDFRVPDNQDSENYQPEFEFEIKVLETLKGEDQPTLTFRHVYDRRSKADLEKAKRAKTPFLLFIDKSQKRTLKPDPYPGPFPVHNPEYQYQFWSNGQQSNLKFDAYVKKVRQVVADNAKLKTTKSFDFAYGNMFTLRVPIDQRYEEVAQKILQGKNPNMASVHHDGMEGIGAVQFLSHFQSPENEKLLKQMLSDSTEAWVSSENTLIKTGYIVTKTYLVRKYAYNVLKEWGVDVEQPTFSIEVPGPKLALEEQEVVWAIRKAGNNSLSFTEPENDTFHLERLTIQVTRRKIPDLTGLSKLNEVSIFGSGEELDLSGIGSPKSVTYFDVSQAKLKDLGPLSGMSSLQTFNAPNGTFSDLSPLSKLTKLTTLNFDHCKQVTDLSPLASLKELQKLNISNTKVKNLNGLANLSELRTIDATKTPLENINALSGSSKLAFLRITGSKVANLEVLAGKQSLKTLNLNGTKVVDLSPLATCPSLTFVSLSRTVVEDLSPLNNLTMLESVYVDRSKVTDVGPLMGSRKLGYLQLTKGAEYQGLKELQQRYPKVRLYYEQ